MKHVFIICGPTASGKTALSINLAKRLNTQIISTDSRQVFRELNIGVAKPDSMELATIKHHFIGCVSIWEEFTAGRFAREAREFLNHYFDENDSIVICGGTGLYINALTKGIDRSPVNEDVRIEVNSWLEKFGLEFLVKKLQEFDPQITAQMQLDNPRRVQRMLEWVLSGKPVSMADDWPNDWKIHKFGIELPREVLYERINKRVDHMIEAGLWNEASNLFEQRNQNALQTVGYQEIFESISGNADPKLAIEKIKQHTRNYAKRQMTWFKKDLEISWLSSLNQAEMVDEILASQGN